MRIRSQHRENGIVAGEDYFKAITQRESDRQARSAFQDLVMRIAAPDDCIFDFGAGPGIDAKFYAGRGFKVLAYDVDKRMCATFSEYCQTEIESGQVQLIETDYRSFIESSLQPTCPAADLVTANFAPLNLVDAPHELFRRFHELTTADAQVFLSVLNPDFIGDMKYSWWWMNRNALRRHGCFCIKGPAFNVYRRSVAHFAAQAAPFFTLREVFRGLPRSTVWDSRPLRRFALRTSQYVFLLFSKS